MKFGFYLVFAIISLSSCVSGQSYEDKRCKCVCPSINSVINNNSTHNESTEERFLIIDNVPPNKCNCVGVILPRIGDKLKQKEKEFCPRCECVYENRNTTIIKVVVIIVIWIISLLACYMAFLSCLDPLLNKRAKANYQEHTNEDEDPAGPSQAQLPMPGGSRGSNMLKLDKWKRQVKEQRRNIYDRHTMLN